MNDSPGSTSLVNSGLAGGSAGLVAGTHTYTLTGSKLIIPVTANDSFDIGVPNSFRTYPQTTSAWVTPYLRADKTAGAYGGPYYPPNTISNDVLGRGGFGFALNVWSDGGGGNRLDVNWSINVPGTYLANTRYHVVIVSTSSSTLVYVNGVLGYSGGPSGVTDMWPSTLRMGRHNDDGSYSVKRFWFGELDDVRVYNSVVSADQVSILYYQGPK